MSIEQRLEVIQALTTASARLSSDLDSTYMKKVCDISAAIQQIQEVLKTLQIEQLSVHDSSYGLAKKVMK